MAHTPAETAPCPCRTSPHPATVSIAPALTHLNRMVATWAGFRAAMLGDASLDPRLTPWRARERGDPGVLLVEMWAQACHIIAFADETISHECYLRTARRHQSLTELVALLGHRPRPAIACSVELSIEATGRQPVTIPAGTRFRSGPVGDGPPQLFETSVDSVVHPLLNRFQVADATIATLGELQTAATGEPVTLSEITIELEAAGLQVGGWVWVRTPLSHRFSRAGRITKLRGSGPARAVVGFDPPITLDPEVDPATVEVWTSNRHGLLWSISVPGVDSAAISAGGTTIVLNQLERTIAVGDRIVIERNGRHRWFTVAGVTERSMATTADVDYKTDEGDYTLPGIAVPATTITLDTGINNQKRRTDPDDIKNWDQSVAAEITVRFGWQRSGTMEQVPSPILAPNPTVNLAGPLDQPPSPPQPNRVVLVDRDGRTTTTTGTVDFAADTLSLDGDLWDAPLRRPVRVDANLITATRGETVTGEVLGSGDGAAVNQRFTLANSPLTHLGPASSSGTQTAVSTLTIRVDGIRWDEVENFVDQPATARVYTTSTRNDGTTEVSFGNGITGSRLPTGTNNIVADYRFGAGARGPQAGGITQLVDSVPAVSAVINRAGAFGGADAETAEELRTTAPRNALLLGRIVSRHDAAAAALAIDGVEAVDARLRWQPDRLRSAVVVTYIGSPDLVAGIRRRLRALSEDDAFIDAVVSEPKTITVSLTISPDPRWRRDDVTRAVTAALVGPGGILTPAVLGVDGPLYRSRLVAAAATVDGVVSVGTVLVDGSSFETLAITPPPGGHLDGRDGLVIDFEERSGP